MSRLLAIASAAAIAASTVIVFATATNAVAGGPSADGPVIVRAADDQADNEAEGPVAKTMGSMAHDGMGHEASSEEETTGPDYSKAFMRAASRMHMAMGEAMTGDPDVDFVRGMIPHHQGAIDMAEIELRYGSDPELRKLAEGIIAAQKTEIAEMKAWLEKHGH